MKCSNNRIMFEGPVTKEPITLLTLGQASVSALVTRQCLHAAPEDICIAFAVVTFEPSARYHHGDHMPHEH